MKKGKRALLAAIPLALGLTTLFVAGHTRGRATADRCFAELNRATRTNWEHKRTRLGFSNSTLSMLCHWQFNFENEKRESETFVTTLWGSDFVGTF